MTTRQGGFVRWSVRALVWATLFASGVGCRTLPGATTDIEKGEPDIALVGGTIHPTPGAAPIVDGVVLVSGGRIRAVGPRDSVHIPEGTRVVDVSGQTVLPGFWTSHVHFTAPVWEEAATLPAAKLERQLQDFLLRYGFVRAYDLGSAPSVFEAIRRRIQRGEVRGPVLLGAGGGLVPLDGAPVYLPPGTLPEASTPEVTRAVVRRALDEHGKDAIKLFTVSVTRQRPFPVMSSDSIRVATEEAHARGKPVFAHPTNVSGVTAAVEGGVDILAHTVSSAEELPEALQQRIVSKHVALIPTLSLWEPEFKRAGAPEDVIARQVAASQKQLARHVALGGRVLFGTDAGYEPDVSPLREYVLMKEAGMDFHRILASLTTEPAAQFHQEERFGRLAPGLDGDVVVVQGDPTQEIEALARVRLTLRQGRIVFQAE
ncbi:amidohydrolase family protein [Myxococcus landrumensis]|uniref:Amidohydrolase family protein n=1 Tax=Myxococcus landrumensis TaxID=2813577 RepID=A0ABX7NFH6_9BACT|nr:amidohydrolase family protein [Myxococcus landrumus]QSQ17565.1 amidohydrolase family protein [Myxococcus landrumus]